MPGKEAVVGSEKGQEEKEEKQGADKYAEFSSAGDRKEARSRKVRVKPIEEKAREGRAGREAGERTGNKWLTKWGRV